jgi:hypothetical protein
MNMSYGRTPRRIEVTSGMMNHGVFVAIPVLYGGKNHYSSSLSYKQAKFQSLADKDQGEQQQEQITDLLPRS